jgi:hypothetical protein
MTERNLTLLLRTRPILDRIRIRFDYETRSDYVTSLFEKVLIGIYPG